MIVLISGTNRPDCNTLKVAKIVHSLLEKAGAETELLNLQELPAGLFDANLVFDGFFALRSTATE